ncbi:hypothetical protein BC830DRAFT_265026 [Chytriomyces sp. MP71]|nr:hypothetical protein BC830DRAFT_265026 [Chytriomyces sp. MP71]
MSLSGCGGRWQGSIANSFLCFKSWARMSFRGSTFSRAASSAFRTKTGCTASASAPRFVFAAGGSPLLRAGGCRLAEFGSASTPFAAASSSYSSASSSSSSSSSTFDSVPRMMRSAQPASPTTTSGETSQICALGPFRARGLHIFTTWVFEDDR